MVKRLLVLATLGTLLSGCYMAPLALIGPISSNFSTASLMQSGFSTTASYLVKKSTGKTISEHAIGVITEDIMVKTYFPKNESTTLILPK